MIENEGQIKAAVLFIQQLTDRFTNKERVSFYSYLIEDLQNKVETHDVEEDK